MRILRNRTLQAGAVGIVAAMQVACAHAPATAEGERKAAVQDKVFVTGSHIPVRVDPKKGMPVTTSPVSVYSYDQLVGTGRGGDLRSSIGALDPSVGP